MTTKIITFPAQPEKPCEELEKHIRMYLAEISKDKDFINSVSNRMRHYIENYASKSFDPTFNLIVPPNLSQEQADALLLSINKGVEETAKEVQGMVRKMIMERLHLEIDIYINLKDIKYRLCRK